MDRVSSDPDAAMTKPTGRRPGRMIAVWNSDGSSAGSMIATAAQERKIVAAGGFVTDGPAPQGARLDPETGIVESIDPVPVQVAGNTISQIPAGAQVFVGCTEIVPKDGAVTLVPELGIADRVRVTIMHGLYEPYDVDIEIAPHSRKGAGREVLVPQNADVMRASAYANEIGDGNQIDVLAKALGDILTAMPELDGPGVREAKDLIARRAAIKTQIPKPMKG